MWQLLFFLVYYAKDYMRERQPSSPLSAKGIGMNNILGNILCALWWWWVASKANRPYYCSRPLWAIYSCRAKENSQ